MTSAERNNRARVAATRHHPNDKKKDELATDPEADRLSQYIRCVVDEAPPLSAEQRDRLAVLLHGTRRER